MRGLAMLFGAALLGEGLVKQVRPKEWMSWLVKWPLAYMPESVVRAGREYRDLSEGALRLLGLIEAAAGAMILWLAATRVEDR